MGQGKKISYRVLETIRLAAIGTPYPQKQTSRTARNFLLSLVIMVQIIFWRQIFVPMKQETTYE
jgi:hypothetical protein